MGKQKNKSHKKKRIAKHILQARERRKDPSLASSTADADTNGDTKTDAPPSSSSLSPPSSSSDIQKYIQMGQQYLSEWNHQRKSSAVGIWKFRKNTQTWLLRNMYDVDKIPKPSFQILMEYMEGIKGDATRDWVQKDAIRRVLRYKEWEKANEKTKEGVLVGVGQESSELDKNHSNGNEDETKEKDLDQQHKGDKKEMDDLTRNNEERFKSLSDHDKRKEYKRARKVLEALKKQDSAGQCDDVAAK